LIVTASFAYYVAMAQLQYTGVKPPETTTASGCFPKGHILPCKRWPFSVQKDIFYEPKGGLLQRLS